MSSKREQMRRKAQTQLGKTESVTDAPMKTKKEKTPSFASGFWLILLGSTTMILFFTINQVLLGILAGAAFTFIGSMRISKASARKTKNKMHQKDE